MQPQEKGGTIFTIDVCQWNVDHDCFMLGVGFDSGVGHGCATHWCEISDLELPT